MLTNSLLNHEMLRPVKFIKPEIKTTKDGSQTLFVSALDEGYHSWHGAAQESMHVYISEGLKHVSDGLSELNVFELGLGTGLNAFLTALYAAKTKLKITYEGIEKFPVDPDVLGKLNYQDLYGNEDNPHLFEHLSSAKWDEVVDISPYFKIRKIWADFLSFENKRDFYDVFYFDAFGFRAQEELWTHASFQKCFDMLRKGGVLVTYASKGVARRTMEAIGFTVERIPGPPGKREMMRATKV
jgi:tRNA U34 5-methylaminomethyl-2-thiouridine-forming methyltransferase MnmC